MTVEERLAAVERAVTDDEVEPAALSDAATVERRLDAVEDRLEAFEERLATVEAGVDAVRGHVGDERGAVDEVERTAATALAAAHRVERRLEDASDGSPATVRTQGSLCSAAADRERAHESDPVADDSVTPRRWLARLVRS